MSAHKNNAVSDGRLRSPNCLRQSGTTTLSYTITSFLLSYALLLATCKNKCGTEAFLLSEQPFRYGALSSGGSLEDRATAQNAPASSSREFGNFNAADASRVADLLEKYNQRGANDRGGSNSDNANLTMRNLCYCSYGAACDFPEICIKHDLAACFHAIRQVYTTDLSISDVDDDAQVQRVRRDVGGFMQSQHFYGCAPFERGTNASHLTCNSWRSVHATPTSIACCYDGYLCNMNITPVSHNRFRDSAASAADAISTLNMSRSGRLFAAAISVAIGGVAGGAFLLFIFLLLLPICFRRHEPYVKKKLPHWLWQRINTTLGVKSCKYDGCNISNSGLTSLAGACDVKQPLTLYDDAFDHDATGSGSGSGGVTLNQRTIALDLTMLETVARGRYGEVRKAIYRSSVVAVKIFYTTEEESWKNERDIYQTQMLNHENILQYVAADISSSVESLTQMMLITDYHIYGSLYDYLRDYSRACAACWQHAEAITAGPPPTTNGSVSSSLWSSSSPTASLAALSMASIAATATAAPYPGDVAAVRDNALRHCDCRLLGLNEALQIAFSIISGLEHLHNALHGTGSRRKPEIAHRDIKSKNMIVKRPGICCVADFGLAVRCENNVIIPEKINVQVGTKRYMAPEVLSRSLNTANFDEFKAADIYSFALVLWEVLNVVRIDDSVTSESMLCRNASQQQKNDYNNRIHQPQSTVVEITRSRQQLQVGQQSSERQQLQKHYLHEQQAPQQTQPQQRRVISRSSSSGIATGASDRSTSYLLPVTRSGYYYRRTPLYAPTTRRLVMPHHYRTDGSITESESEQDAVDEDDSDANAEADDALSTDAENVTPIDYRRHKYGASDVTRVSTATGAPSLRRHTSAPTSSPRISRLTSEQPQQKTPNSDATVCLHRLPYQDIIECDPSLEDMFRIVCEARARPTFARSAEHVLFLSLLEGVLKQY